MSEAGNLFTLLRQSADPGAVTAVEGLVRDAPDHDLCRVNVIDFASRASLDEERAIAAFLHAARLGIFELSWNVLCPGCGGVLDTSTTLKSVNHEEYDCALCAAGYEPTLDEMVEVTFTVSRRVSTDRGARPARVAVRRIFPADLLGLRASTCRRISSSVVEEITLDAIELPPGEKALPVAAVARRVRDRHGSGHARDAVSRRQGRADARAAKPLARFRQGARADRHGGYASWPAAAVAGKPHRYPAVAWIMDRRRQASRAARQASAIPDGETAADQPSIPRHLSGPTRSISSSGSRSPA